MSIFNNPDFYPTPDNISHLLCQKVNIQGKVVFEPSMGKGDLVDVIKTYFPKQVIGCEISDDLLKISSQKVDRVICKDFLEVTKDQVSHINYIIANPPFSCADKHILHMWELAPEGCEIVTLCNWETIENDYSRNRSKISRIIKENGYTEYLGECFSDAERKTNVKVGVIVLYKPIVSEENYDMYFDMFEVEEKQEEGLMQYNEIRNIVNRYVGALKMFDSVAQAQKQINDLITPIRTSEHGLYFQAVDKNKNTVTFETFKSELQKSAWVTVFNKLGAEKYMTSKLKEFLNKFVEQQKNVPFTMSNIYKMIEMVIGTHGDRMNKVIIEVFDWLTAHHSENRFQNEGWKTNSEYVVNKRFIAPYCGLSSGESYPYIRWSSGGNRMDDLLKAVCYITGTKFNEKDSIERFFNWSGEVVESEKVTPEHEREEGFSYLEDHYKWQDSDRITHETRTIFKFKEEPDYFYRLSSGYDKSVIRYRLYGKWYNWTFFKVKVFKKGTFHAEFLDDKVWELFNRTAAKAKGFELASTFRSNYRQKGTGVEIYG
jgi:predicted RNA methylase